MAGGNKKIMQRGLVFVGTQRVLARAGVGAELRSAEAIC